MNEAVSFRGVSRHFGAVRAVDNVDLDIRDGEFFAMLGPSGSGKTTCLRLIAGFEQPTAGEIMIYGESAAGVPPYRRNVNTVFQDYALFPHMTVRDNVAYGLMVRGVDRRTRHARANDQYFFLASDCFLKSSVIQQVINGIHQIQTIALQGCANALSAPGNHQFAVTQFFITQTDFVISRINRCHFRNGKSAVHGGSAVDRRITMVFILVNRERFPREQGLVY